MVDLTPYLDDLARSFNAIKEKSYSDDPRSDFASKLAEDGFRPESQIVMGRIVRIDDPVDKPKKRTGWYWYDEFEIKGNILGVGVYGTWRDPDNKCVWSSRSQTLMTVEEAYEYRSRLEASQLARDIEHRAVYAEKAIESAKEYNEAVESTEHPYFTKKQIKSVYGTRTKNGVLLVPIINDQEQLVSLQRIYEQDGEIIKKNKAGGKMKGGFFRIIGDSNVCICEGMATGASINEATGATVYCAMSAANIYEVASVVKKKHQNVDVIICADDNSENAINTGLDAARRAGDVFRFRVVSPTVLKDFNDQACANGLQSVKDTIFPPQKKYEQEKKVNEKSYIEPPPGFLLDMFNYYNATSGHQQFGFSLQTALAAGSVFLGRRYRTDEKNFTSLFFLNIGKSGTGKEHAKTVVSKVLSSINCTELLGGSGYTSEGAVVSTCIIKPRHISICDEFGRNLLAAKMSGGDKNLHGANTKLMEAIGQCDTIMLPRNYSTMGMKKDQADALQKPILNPAITIIAMSTPETFYEAVDYKSIADGFIGRFIACVSDVDRDIRRRTAKIEVPESIKDWIHAVHNRAKHGTSPDLAHDEPPIITIPIAEDAYERYDDAQRYFLKQSNDHEQYRINSANNRASEFVLRVALIVALSKNPNAEIVAYDDVDWAFSYIRSCVDRVFSDLKHKLSGSDFESRKKEALDAFRKLGVTGITLRDMNKKQPFAKWNSKDRKEILESLEEAELIFKESTSTGGRTATIYYARGE